MASAVAEQPASSLPNSKANGSNPHLVVPKPLSERRHLVIPPLYPSQTESLRTEPTTTTTTTEDTKKPETSLEVITSFLLDAGISLTPQEELTKEEAWTDNVQQLIRETDEAFKAVGLALADVQNSEEITNLLRDLQNSKRASASGAQPVAQPQPQPKLQGPTLPQGTPVTRPPPCEDVLETINPTPPLKTISRSVSVSHPKRKRSTKSKKARRSMAPISLKQRMPRWSLSENMSGLFSGHMFRKVEVDEMLTPARLEAVRASKAFQIRQRESCDRSEWTDSEASDTPPTGPSPIEEVDSLLEQSIGTPSPEPVAESSVDSVQEPGPSRPTFLIPRKATPKSSATEVIAAVPDESSSSSQNSEEVVNESDPAHPTDSSDRIASICPPPKNPARFGPKVAVSEPDALATAPKKEAETENAGVEPHTTKAERRQAGLFAPAEDEDSVLFHSTPFSLTVPTFKHGPIRCPKSEMARFKNMGTDDTLDWSAFQMAILGGAGELFSDPSDFGVRKEQDEAEELAAWFDRFGFETMGELVPAGPPRSPSTSSLDSRSSSVYSASPSSASSLATDLDETELPIPVDVEFPNGFWDGAHAGKSKFVDEHGANRIKRWTMEGGLKAGRGDVRDSLTSLPQSPMMELAIMGDGEMVPMGYNLGHDLDDFLRWEAQNVSAWAD